MNNLEKKIPLDPPFAKGEAGQIAAKSHSPIFLPPSFAKGGVGGGFSSIIGIGSPFGEDQAGWDAVDALAGEAWVQARLAAGTLVLEKLDRPGMALLDHLRGHAHVILIDAVLSAEHCPGTWLALPREELALLAFPASSHGIGVAEALAMGETLGMLPEKLEIWGIVVPELC